MLSILEIQYVIEIQDTCKPFLGFLCPLVEIRCGKIQCPDVKNRSCDTNSKKLID